MKKDEKIRKILNRLQEIHNEKESFIAARPLDTEESPRLWGIEEFRKYGKLCGEEEQLLRQFENLMEIG